MCGHIYVTSSSIAAGTSVQELDTLIGWLSPGTTFTITYGKDR